MKSRIEISRRALAANVAAIRAAAPGADVLAVIKADGYGHRATELAPALADAGVRWLGVTDAEEGARVRAALGNRDIRLLVMVAPEPADAETLVQHNLTPVIWTPEHLHALKTLSISLDRPFPFHLEIDTGMSRQGVLPGPDLTAFLQTLAHTPHLRCEALMTHFVESEVANSAVTRVQQTRFEAALEQLRSAGIRPQLLHAANTSAVDEASTIPWLADIAARTGAQTLVRPGLAVYGYCLPIASGQPRLAPHLTPALTWKTRILDTRTLAPGVTVGYGATFTAPSTMRLALLPVGYADGFRRTASSGLGNGWVIIHGHRAPVLGRVSMNLTTVDITHIPTAATGDEVTLLGTGVTAEDHARWSATIAYDILCGIRAKHTIT